MNQGVKRQIPLGIPLEHLQYFIETNQQALEVISSNKIDGSLASLYHSNRNSNRASVYYLYYWLGIQ